MSSNVSRALLAFLPLFLLASALLAGVEAAQFNLESNKNPDQDAFTCLVYLVDSYVTAPHITVRIESNLTSPADAPRRNGVMAELRAPPPVSSKVVYRHLIQFLDEQEHKRQQEHSLILLQGDNKQATHVIDFQLRQLDGTSNRKNRVEEDDFPTGEYKVCFGYSPSSRSKTGVSYKDRPAERITVFVQETDTKTSEHFAKILEKTGRKDALGRDQNPMKHDKKSLEKQYLSDVDLAWELLEYQVDEIKRDSRYFLSRSADLSVTANSTFTRVWFLGLMTIATMRIMMKITQRLMENTFKKHRFV